MFVKPRLQVDIVGEAPEEGHRGVSVRVDEPGDERVGVERYFLRRPIPGRRLFTRQEVGDLSLHHDQGVVFEDCSGGRNRHYPRGGDEGVGGLHAVGSRDRKSRR